MKEKYLELISLYNLLSEVKPGSAAWESLTAIIFGKEEVLADMIKDTHSQGQPHE